MNVRETILQNANIKKLSLKNKLVNTSKGSWKGEVFSLYCRAYISFIEKLTHAVWILSLLKTSVQVTRTPLTTIRSLLEINLPKKAKTDESQDSNFIYKGKLTIPIETSLNIRPI